MPLEQTLQDEEASEGRGTRPARGWSGVCCGTRRGIPCARWRPGPVRLGDAREAPRDSRWGYRIRERENKKKRKKGIKKKKEKDVIDILYEI